MKSAYGRSRLLPAVRDSRYLLERNPKAIIICGFLLLLLYTSKRNKMSSKKFFIYNLKLIKLQTAVIVTTTYF